MRIPDPVPAAKGMAVAAACLAAIPAACRWIEAHPAVGLVAVLVVVRFSAARASLPRESEVEPANRSRRAAGRLRS
ncbi:MAG TPA: hypothetical protein VMB03_13940 [Bryobacteraceae bacterium]|nr:hypothetical protein [Bryobacteraceae bacterium]